MDDAPATRGGLIVTRSHAASTLQLVEAALDEVEQTVKGTVHGKPHRPDRRGSGLHPSAMQARKKRHPVQRSRSRHALNRVLQHQLLDPPNLDAARHLRLLLCR